MDPLSIIASTIAIATTVAQSLRKLRDIYKAPEELQKLADTIERFTPVLRQISIAFGSSSVEHIDSPDDGLLSLVQSANTRLNRLNDIYQRHAVENTSPGDKQRFKRLHWQKFRSEVTQISEELEKDHSSIQTVLSSMSFRRLEIQLKSIADVKDKVSTMETSLRLLSTQTTTVPNKSLSENETNRVSLRQLALQENYPKVFEVTIDTARKSKSSCKPGCGCVCHATRRLKSPRVLDGLLGSLVLKLPQNLIGQITCNESTCKRKDCSTLKFSYYLPGWLIMRAIIGQIHVDPLAEQRLGLRVIKIAADDAEVFNFAKYGDIDSLIPIFEKGLASPNVVNHSWHVPLLNYAVQGNHIRMCEFLLKAGADPTIENRSSMWALCALDRAWDTFLTKSAGNEVAIALQRMFSLYSDSPWIEEQQFHIPHKIVLELSGTPLDSLLETSTTDINKKDSKGRTALSWAAIRGDVNSLKVLLKYGADPDIRTSNGNAPLMFAVRAPSPACIAPLLQYGVTVNSQNAQGFSALHYAAYYKNDRSYLEPLIESGADTEASDQYGWSPLISAVEYDHLESAKTLLSCGANIEHRDKDGLTPLHHSIIRNSHQVLATLLMHGADQRAITKNGETILHFAAKSGDSKTLDILLSKLSEAVDFDARDFQKLTALDVMGRRSDSTASLKEQFQNLIEKARTRGRPAGILEEERDLQTGEDPDSPEVFVDALELQV